MKKIEEKYSLTSEGILNILFDKIKFFPNRKSSIRFKILFFVLTMGVPLFILAAIQGQLWPSDVEIPLLEDYENLTRLFVALPILFLAERKIDAVFSMVMNHLDDLIIEEDKQKFGKMILRLNNLLKSIWPELVFLVTIYIKMYYDIETKKDVSNWFYTGHGLHLKFSFAGWWFILYCLPIFQLVIIRWFWHWALCIYLLFKISSYRLKLYAAHGDEMGGIRFLAALPFSFNTVTFALGCVVSASIGTDIIHRGEEFSENVVIIILYILSMALIFLGPLLLYGAQLTYEKIKGVILYSALINDHHNAFYNKWFKEGEIDQNKLLGSADVSSFADINGGFQSVKNMKLIPLSKPFFYRFVITTAIPFIPLILTEYSYNDLYQKLLEKIMG